LVPRAGCRPPQERP